ncbi:hypothetical protein Tco_0073132 [Tanacetum coccineum]
MLSTMNLIHMCLKDSILQAGNPMKEILRKLNLLDHKSILTDSKIHIKMDKEVPDSSDEVLKLKNFQKDASLKLSS